MARETVSVRFDAETSGYTSKVDAAAKSTEKLGQAAEKASRSGSKMGDGLGKGADQATTKFGRLSQAVTKHSDGMEKVGTTMTVVGAALTGAAALAGKAAMDWESSWAGVTKTVDGSATEMAALEGQLRQMARTLPATHQEIAAVAEAAGQLGVRRGDIAGFTRTMIDLGETTNLTADEAATSLAQFMNIMGTAGDDVDNLGSALVALGNDGASTEKDILNMSLRIAAVGKQMGMTEAEVMGLASAMSSVGIEAEAGGTAISTVMKKIDASVRDGGEGLSQWAELAGMTAAQFKQAWETDAAGALTAVTTGLGEAGAAGGDMNGMLSELGIKGIREADTMLRLAQSGDLLADSFRTGGESFESASALAAEATKRYETAESRIRVAWNNIKDAAIDAGGALLPVVANIAEGASQLVQAFGQLPGPVKGTIGLIAGISGVALLAGGALLKLAPSALDTYNAFRELQKTAPGVASGIGKVGKAAGIAAVALVGLQVAGAIQKHFQAGTASSEEFGQALVGLKDDADAFSSIDFSPNAWSMGESIDSLGDALARANAGGLTGFGDSVNDVVKSITGWESQNHEVDASIAAMDASMAAFANSGSFEHAAAGFREAVEEGERVGLTIEQVAASFPQYINAVRDAATAQGTQLEGADLLRVALEGVGPAADGAASGVEGAGTAMEESAAAAEELEEQIKAAVEAIESMGSEGRTVAEAQDAFQARIRGVTESIKENGKSLDNTTEKGAANREALRGLATDGAAAAARMAEFGGTQAEVKGQLMGTYDSLVTAAGQFGITGAEADLLARDMLGIPRDVDIETYMDQEAANVAALTKAEIDAIPGGVQVIADMSDGALKQAYATAEGIKAIPGYKNVSVAVDDKGTPGQVQSRINAVTGKEEFIFVKDDGTSEDVQKQIMNINGKDVPVYVKDDGTVVIAQNEINGIHGKSVRIEVNADTSGAQAAINSIQGKRVNIDVVRRNFGQAAVAKGGIAGLGYFPKHSEGRLPAHAMGRLPYTGRGTDRILGVNAEGWPVARVDDGEAIINERSTVKHLGLLTAINDDDTLRIRKLVAAMPAHATGRVEAPRQWAGASPTIGVDYQRLAEAVGGGTVDARQYTFPVQEGASLNEAMDTLRHEDRRSARRGADHR